MIYKNKEQQADDEKEKEKQKNKPKNARVHKKKGTYERPEITFAERKIVQDVGYLVPRKQAEGENLINEFLDKEKQYCTILECLHSEYYISLVRYADQGKFEMTRKEIDQIFVRIPDLLK